MLESSRRLAALRYNAASDLEWHAPHAASGGRNTPEGSLLRRGVELPETLRFHVQIRFSCRFSIGPFHCRELMKNVHSEVNNKC